MKSLRRAGSRLWLRTLYIGLGIAAIGYLANLAYGHMLQTSDSRLQGYVQQAGIDAVARSDSFNDFESLILHGTKKRATATWNFSAPHAADASDHAGTHSDVTIIGPPVLFFKGSGTATVSIGGAVIAKLRAIALGTRGRGPFKTDPQPDIVDLPPSANNGYRFPIPATTKCAPAACTLTIEISHGTWNIQRVAILRTVDPRAGPPVWPRNVTGLLWVFVAALALGGTSGLLLRKRSDGLRLGPASAGVTLVALFYGSLILAQGNLPASITNVRSDRLERIGSEAVASSGRVTFSSNYAVIGAKSGARPASAVWQLDSYEFDHYLSGSACDIEVYVVGPTPRGLARDASADLLLDNRLVSHIRFGKPTMETPVGPGELGPSGVIPAQIYYTPIFQRFGYRIDTGARLCHSVSKWRLRVSVHRAIWQVDRIGVVLHYTPKRITGLGLVPIAAAAIAVLLALAALVHVLLTLAYRRFGVLGLIGTTAILLVAPLTHDEWDFPVWLRFIDLLAFGHGDPAYMWAGSPLWPFLPGTFFGPVLVAAFGVTGNASNEIPSMLLKLSMSLALGFNAYAIAGFARRSNRAFVFFCGLFAPVGLYEITGGYREVFAASFAIAGIALSLRGSYAWSGLLMALGTSVSESIAPLLLLPGAMALADWKAGALALKHALLPIVIAVGVLAAEWVLLIPHSFAAYAVETRVEAYRYGGASWFAVLDNFHLLPSWFGPHSLAIVAVLFAVLALPIVIGVLRTIFVSDDPIERRHRTILGSFTALVAALFLAYRGIDPNDWYPFFAIVLFYYVCYEPESPFPLVLGVLQGLGFYTILGIGDFVNWSYFKTSDRGLLGTLSTSMIVLNASINLTMFAYYASVVLRRPRMLFSKATFFYAALFFGSALTSASHDYAIDATFGFGASVAIGIALYRISRLHALALPRTASLPSRWGGSLLLVGLWASSGPTHVAAGVVTVAALLVGSIEGFGLCDIVLVGTGIELLSLETSFGWVSICGWIVISLLAAYALVQRATTLSLPKSRASDKRAPT